METDIRRIYEQCELSMKSYDQQLTKLNQNRISYQEEIEQQHLEL